MSTSESGRLWVSAAICLHLLRWAEGDGLPLEELLADSGLGGLPRTGTRMRVPVEQQYRLWHAIAAHRQVGFGWRSGREMALAHVPTLGPLLTTSRSVRDCFATLADFAGVTSNAVVASWAERGDGSGVLELHYLHPEHPPEATRSALSNWLYGIGRGAGAVLPIREVDFPFPDDGVPLPRDFGRAVVRHGAPRLRVVLDASVMGTPMLGADERLNAGVKRLALEDLNSRDSARLSCLRALAALAPRSPQGLVAKRMGVSVRALQRALWAEGVTFRDLQGQDLLRRATELMLVQPELPIDQVADRLGFGRRAFERAFKRWTGLTPGRWRRRGG